MILGCSSSDSATAPEQLVWCGGDSVVLAYEKIVFMVGPSGSWINFRPVAPEDFMVSPATPEGELLAEAVKGNAEPELVVAAIRQLAKREVREEQERKARTPVLASVGGGTGHLIHACYIKKQPGSTCSQMCQQWMDSDPAAKFQGVRQLWFCSQKTHMFACNKFAFA